MSRPILPRLARALGFHAWRIYSRRLGGPKPTRPAGIDLRIMQPEELERHWAIPDLEFSASKAKESFARGEVCVGALDGPHLAAYAWFTNQAAPHQDGIWMDFDRRAIYTYRAFVRPEYRGRAIAPALYCHADRLFLGQGRESAILCIAADNPASLSAARRSGARDMGLVMYAKKGGAFLTFRALGVRRTGFHFYLA